MEMITCQASEKHLYSLYHLCYIDVEYLDIEGQRNAKIRYSESFRERERKEILDVYTLIIDTRDN